QMAGPDSGESRTRRPLQIDHPPSGEVAFECASCFLFDLSPRRIGNGSELAMQIIHGRSSPLREPMPREPSRGRGDSRDDASVAGSTGDPEVKDSSSPAASKNSSLGTKNRLPVTARLKSSKRS